MKEVKSKKPFLEAIQNGEQQIKITDTYAKIMVEKDENGHLTGVVEIV